MQQSESLVNALGHGMVDKRIDILRQIGQGGSISQAARAAGVSYKAAWQALDTLTNLAGVTLVERVVGGAGGGGARLTPAAEQLLAAADAVRQARVSALAQLEGGGADLAVARLSLRT
ncbi:MAG TPA: LysR family transcriptional regulator, partial [Alicycliphilus sp.]|nr:LysR family transcriptional regulator [Alicycliphilus sp.]